MKEDRFIARKVAGWRRLQELTQAAAGGLHRMPGDRVAEFVRLYRGACSDLAHLRSHSSNRDTAAYLNAILTVAYAALYRRKQGKLAESLALAFREGCSSVRRHAWAVWLGVALFLGGGLAAMGLLEARPDLADYIVQPEMRANFDSWKRGSFDARTAGESVAMTSFYATNNPRAGILLNVVAVATFGLGTAYIEWQNGLLVGALAHEMAGVGLLGFLLASLMPHGVSEIGGFCITGAGGFVLGRALLAPGRRRRSEALADAGRDAFRLLCTGLAMIFAAAPIEGFVSFNPQVPMWFKPLFGLATLAGFWLVFRRYGDDPKRENSPEATAPASRSMPSPVGRSPSSGGT